MTRRILTATLLFLFLAGAAHAAAVGEKAPPFIGNDTSGSTLWVKRYFGKKVIILTFDSTYSTASTAAIREIERLRGLVPGDAIQVISVNVDANSPDRIRNLYSAVLPDRIYPVLIDDKWTIARQDGLHSVPTRIVIDRQGVIRYVAEGIDGLADKGLETAVRDTVAGKKAKTPPKAGKAPKKGGAPAPSLDLVAPTPFTKTLTGMITVAGAASPGALISVSVDGARLDPAAGLGSWAAFQPARQGAMMMGDTVLFVSGYTNKEQPNLWDRSAEVRAAS